MPVGITGLTAVAIVVSVLIGAILQRLSGAGMGMVLAPMLTLALGAADGVMLANGVTMFSAALMGWAVRRSINWRKAGIICAAAAPGSFLGAVLVKQASAAWLQIIVGVTVLGALAFTAYVGKLGKLPHVTSVWSAIGGGSIGAFFNTICGVSAPALVIHARLTRWQQREFAASLQPIFFTMAVLSLLMKGLLGSTSITGLPPLWLIGLVIATILIGIRIGTVLEPRLGQERAKKLTFALAGAGAASALVRGLLAL